MPRKKNIKDTIQHKLYRNAYLKCRGEVIYFHLHHEGKEIRKSSNLTWHPDNFQLALRLLEEKYLNIVEPGIETYSLSELFDNFLKLKSKSIKHDSILKYQQVWKVFIQKDYHTGQMPELRKDINDIISNTYLSNNTVIKYLDQLSAFFRYCLENKYIDQNPIGNSLYPKYTKQTPKAYTLEEIEMLQNSFPVGSDSYNLIKLIKNTGMRLIEAATLKKENIHDDHIIINGKGNVDRVFPILPNTELYELLQELKRKSQPFKYKNSKRAGDQLCSLQKKIGMELTGYHPIRKYYENFLIDSGVPVKVTAQLLGHTTAIQSQHYITQLAQSELKKELQKLA